MSEFINFRIVLKVVSRILLIDAAALFVCAGVALSFGERMMPFIYSSLIAFTTGVLFYLIALKQREYVTMQRKDSYLTVASSWIIIGLTGCLPYMFSGAIPSFTDALFESVSGFSTTGSSILTDIEVLPRSILFWRSLTHWIGGIGIIVMVIVIMPSLQMGGYRLFTLESSLQEKIKPKITAVGKQLLLIYVVLTVAEIILLMAGKMSFFESVCHAFGTMATGGFSPKNASIAAYSPYIQYVVMFFMLLAGTNFVIYFYLLKRNFQKIKENEELKFYLVVIFILGVIITAILFLKMDKPLEPSFREAFFQVISIVTCTGFSTADYLQWPEYGVVIIFFAMFLGGSTGSTAGGIKMARHLIFLKNIQRTFRQLLSPNAIRPIRLNNNVLSEETNNSILTFIAIYFLIFIIGSIAMMVTGSDVETASSAVATCMGGIGPGIGTVGPVSNFAHLPDTAKLILSFLMLVGRLEIYTIMVLFTRNFWME